MSDVSLGDRIRRAPGDAAAALRRWAARQYLAYAFRRDCDHPALSRRAAAADLRATGRLVVLSRANVCRGPFAERYLRDRLDRRGMHGPAVASAALARRGGHASPPVAVETAARYGVDLGDHRSVSARDQRVTDSVVLVPDYASYYAAVSRFPGQAERTYFLSAFADRAPGLGIPDPLGAGPERVRDAFDVISRAADGLLGVLAGDTAEVGHPQRSR